jgi:hypothetical protein
MGSFVALLFSAALCSAAPPTVKVAVLDLSTPGLQAEEGKALSSNLLGIITSEVARLGKSVISSADINLILSFEKQKDLAGCQDNVSCLAEIGGALGVDLLLSGSIGKLGETYNVALTLVDSKNAEVKKRFSGSAGSLEVLATTARRGVNVLFGKETETGGTGTILIKTEPSGASVFIDGRAAGVSPTTIDDVAMGDHLLVVKKEGLSASQQIDVHADVVEKVNLVLKLDKPVKVKVISNPPEATVIMDGTPVGQTPLVLSEVAAGRHALRIEYEGYVPYAAEVTFSREDFDKSGGAPFKVEAELAQRFSLIGIPIVLALGAMVDARYVGDGVAFCGELSVEPLSWLSVGVVYTNPFSIGPNVRFWVYRGVLDLGVFVRAPFYDETSGSYMLSTTGGASVAWAFEVPFGRVGLLFEAAFNYDLRNAAVGFTLPLALNAFWRL